MTLLGQFALWLAGLLGLWGAVIAFAGRWRDRPELAATVVRSVYAVFGCLAVAALALWKGLISHDFNIEYVAAYTSRNLPPYYIFSALWAGQKGSLLFWALVLSLFASLAQLLTSRRHAHLMPYVAGVTSAVVVFFVSVMLFGSNPFERLAFTPDDGRGLNPQLQNVGMVIHPPMLYLGYISITIPFAFAVAALLSGRLDTGWIHAIRKWTLISWLFLAIGITLGMWWAYVELGWGGYWAWDPVENASLLPWLTMTAFLHSVMIQEKRGMLKRWNLGLIIGTFLLSIFGTFITRSGVIASVHSFTQSNVGYFFLAFLVVAAILSFTLLYIRWPMLQRRGPAGVDAEPGGGVPVQQPAAGGDRLLGALGDAVPDSLRAGAGQQDHGGPAVLQPSERPARPLAAGADRHRTAHRLAQGVAGQPEAPVHRAGRSRGPSPWPGCWPPASGTSTRSSRWALAGFVAGTIVQEFHRGVRARRRMHGESAPLALARLVGRNRRRYGGYLVHVGMLIYFVAFSGMAFRPGDGGHPQAGRVGGAGEPVRSQLPAHPHGHLPVRGAQPHRLGGHAWRSTRMAKRIGLMTSEKRQHVDSFERPTFEPSTEVGIRSTLQEDLYVVFAGR